MKEKQPGITQRVFDLLQFLRLVYWKVFDIKTFGVRAIIDNGGSILLVKPPYRNLWVFPGGGIKKNETPEEAARREVQEEVNISIESFERKLGTYKNTTGGKNDTVTVLVAQKWEDRGKKWNIEVEESGFFKPDSLPPAVSRATKARINEYLQGDENLSGDW